MGSGKSFEVVTSVIVPALLKGRRVVTNIDGINPSLITEYLVTVKGGVREKLGEVISVTNEDVCKPGFFPDETNPEQPSVVRGGDLVCVDECWNFWGDDAKITDEHMRFFRMHRHYTDHATGVTCDLALMIQDLGTLNRKIRAVIEMTTRTVKLKSLGAPKAYRCEFYEGNKTTKLTKIDTHVKLYDKAIFPLYKSYAAGSGSEKSIDKRQNVLTNPRIWFMAVLVVVLFVAGGFFVYRFFQPATHKGAAQASPVLGGVTNPKNETKTEFSTDWRYGGTYTLNGNTWAVLVDSQGRVRVESPSVITGSGLAAFGLVDGRKVTSYSGSQGSSLLQGASIPAAPTGTQK